MSLWRFFARVMLAAALAGAAVTALDAALALASARTAPDFAESLRLILSLAVLAAVPAALLGAGEALLLGGLSGAHLRARLTALRGDPDGDRAHASWVLAGALAAAGVGLALARIAPRLFALPDDAPARAGALALRGLILGGVTLGLLAAAALVAWTAARALRPALERVRESWRARFPLTWAALGLCALGTVAGAILFLLPRADLLHAIDGGLVAWGVLFLGLQGAIAWLLTRRRPPGRRRRLRAALAAGVAAASIPAVVLTFDDPGLLSLTYGRTSVGRRVVSLWRAALDFDGDGYSSLLGGGDCDDRDPSVHPGARDLPGNGVDEDCSGADARPSPAAVAPSAPRRPTGTSFLLLTIDTLRADHLGAYGYGRPTSPHLDDLARTSVVFERAFSASNHTPRSIPALLTGLYPSRLAWKKRGNYPPLADEVRTLADDLKAAGYRTAGVFPHWYFHKRRNLHRSFDVWDLSAAPGEDDGSAVTAPQVSRRARHHLRALAAGPSPFFLWVHYYEPHYPYVEHEGIRFGSKMVDRYDGEIRFVDRHIGEVLRDLEAAGVAHNTAVVVTSDHGEAFGEHKKHWHGHALYNEQVRVPFLLRAPGVAAGRVFAPVSTVDLVPTVLEIAGLPERPGLSGRSLLGLARGRSERPGPVFVELLAYPNFPRSMRAVVLGDLKLIHDISENRFELYDLAADPGERSDLLGDRPTEAERLKAILARFADGGPVATLGW
jgi:arylsulfatase A-like enzyme